MACGNEYETRQRVQSYCSPLCGSSSPNRRGRREVALDVIAYAGLTRYTVRPLGASFVVWDTETDTRASLPCALSVATDRALVLERRYGTRSSAAA
jgi:hypothetical protein